VAAGFAGRGRLSCAALTAALAAAVARHESLRTRFAVETGRPSALIVPAVSAVSAVSAASGAVTLHPLEADLSALPAERRAAEAVRAAQELARRPFDLERDLLLRCWVVRQGGDEWALGWVVHHLVSDGASLAILEREIGELYGAALEGRAARLPVLALQPVDLAAAERSEGMGRARWAADLAYWRGELAGLAPLELPTDRPRPPLSRHRGRSGRSPAARDRHRGRGMGARLPLDAVRRRARRLCRGARPLVRADDFGIGVPDAGRRHHEAEGLVGLFVNTLVVRAATAGDPTGAELLARLDGRLSAARAHGGRPIRGAGGRAGAGARTSAAAPGSR